MAASLQPSPQGSTWIGKTAIAVIAAIGGVWAALMAFSWGALVVGIAACIALADYLLSPARAYPSGYRIGSGFRVFWFDDTVAVERRDRRRTGIALFLIGCCLAGGIGAFIRLEFPRQATQLEQLEPRYTRCRELVVRDVSSDEEYAHYRTDWQEWVIATREYIRFNMPQIALERFNDVSTVLPFALDADFNSEHRSLRNRITRYCENLAAIMDNYAN